MIRIRLAAAASAALLTAGAALAEPLAIINARAWTGTEAGTLDPAVILIEEGEITAVSAETVELPQGTEVIDAEGRWVTPGIISAFSRTGITEVNAEDTTNEITAPESAYSAALRAADGFNPAASSIPVTRIEGVTRIIVAPNVSTTIFAGQGLVADTSGAADSVIDPEAFMFVAMGEPGAEVAGGSRPAAWTFLRAAISDARTFPARFIAHNEGDALTRVDAMALRAASRGEQTLLFSANRASDLRQIIALARDNPSLDIAIVGAAEGWMVADELAAAGIGVIIDPFGNLPERFEQLGATQRNAERLIEAGVTTAFAFLTRDTHQARLVLQSAGNAAAHGVAFDEAMGAITTAPAEIFGLDGLGVLEAGAVGDVVVWDGDPLEVMSAPDVVIIDGEITALESRQTRLRDRYLGLAAGDRPFAYRRGE